MTGATFGVANLTITVPPGATVESLGPDTRRVIWGAGGQKRTHTATFTPHGRGVTQWFRRAETWPLLLNKLSTIKNPHVYIGGVATGEEAYSLAMLLDANGVGARIIASDINPDLLGVAQAGIYSRDSVRQALTAQVLEPEIVRRYFRPDQGRLRLTEALRQHLTFEVADLRSATLPESDVFILRNLWRHLGIPGAYRLAREVARALPQNGVLSLGGADGLAGIDAHTELDAVLHAAGLDPVGVGNFYFRR